MTKQQFDNIRQRLKALDESFTNRLYCAVKYYNVQETMQIQAAKLKRIWAL
ncbi:MAG: hypothetical protein NTZ59_02310 [Bacteroidetes bacterium]|nr:hypothetical protein [Bacteroidota bacterium]